MKTQLLYFILLECCFFKIEKISLVGESQKGGKFQTFSGKFEIKVQSVDQFS
jgi:hypothetical protein